MYNSVNNNKSKPTYLRQLDDATPEDTRFKTTGSRGSQNQTNQAYNNFYQKSTRPTNEYWPETNYNDFIEDFNIILKDLIEDGKIIDEDEARDLLLNSLSTQLRRLISFKLIKQRNLQRYNNEEYLMPPISIIKILIENEIKFMKVLDSARIPKSPKVGKSSRPWDIIITFGIKASKITSSNKTEKIIDTTTENFNNIPQPKAQQHKKPEEKESTLATSIGPMVCKTTPLINNTYIDINQGIQNQSEDIKKEEETSTNPASSPDC
ncbi:hypothetical protein BY996DRAFT_6518736 [Phakopsora pachyrhizi]|nr:hypothetical protein BY996DRAFT_6518736 [Phakopsora pachyrhizi]